MSTITAPKLATRPSIPLRTGTPVPGAVNRPVTPVAPAGPAQPPQTLAQPPQTLAQSAAVSETGGTSKRRGRPKAERKEGEDIAGRVKHPAIGVEGGAWPFANLEAVPADFNYKVHQPLTKKDFVNDFDFFTWQAHELQNKANRLLAKAEKYRALGDGQNRKDQQKFLRMQEQMAALAAKLAGDGVDVEALLASVTQGATE